MKIIVILFMLIIIYAPIEAKQQKDTTKIPKILWTFWDSGFEGASLFTKLCINNMNYYTNKSGWEFKFVSKDNFTDYISKEGQERFRRMIATSKNFILLQNHVDIFRLFLLYENGGMWLDTNSFFVNDLSWIQNIEKETTPYNRISSDPDVITFTYNQLFGGNKTRVIDDKTGQQIYLFPGIQIWSFITKPYSKFLKDVIENLQHSLITPRVDLDEQNRKLGINYAHQSESYFLPSNYQFQTVLQKRQKQIQRNPKQYNTKYAIDYYKIWSIDALSTAFAIFQVNDWTVGTVMKSIFHDSLQQFSQKHHAKIYFIKFTGDFYPFIAIFLPYLQFLTCIKTINKIESNSIISKYMFQPSQSMPIIRGIINQSHKLTQDTKCILFQAKQIRHFAIDVILLIIGISAINYLIFLLIKKGNEEKEKENFVKIQNNDS